eukprot:1800142-Rhodomonas_salina.1
MVSAPEMKESTLDPANTNINAGEFKRVKRQQGEAAPLRNQMQATTFSVQFAPGMLSIVFDFAVHPPARIRLAIAVIRLPSYGFASADMGACPAKRGHHSTDVGVSLAIRGLHSPDMGVSAAIRGQHSTDVGACAGQYAGDKALSVISFLVLPAAAVAIIGGVLLSEDRRQNFR